MATKGVFCVASAISLVWIAGRARPGAAPREGEEVTLVALGCLVMLLSSPLAWLHYYVLAVPAALVALRPTDGRGWLQSRLLPAAAILGLAVDPIANLTGLGRPQNVRLYALFVCTGAVILLVLVGFELLRRGDEPDPGGSC